MWPCVTCTETHVVLSRAYRVVPDWSPTKSLDSYDSGLPGARLSPTDLQSVPAVCGPFKLTSILAGQRAG